MNTVPNRVVIYTKDVCNITGLRQRAARRLLTLIRRQLGKHRGAFVTSREFATFTGIPEEVVQAFLV